MHKTEVADALLMATRRGREQGMEWSTAREINQWERARRAVTVESFDGGSITLNSGQPLNDATLLVLNNHASDFEAWGFKFSAQTTSISAGRSTRVAL